MVESGQRQVKVIGLLNAAIVVSRVADIDAGGAAALRRRSGRPASVDETGSSSLPDAPELLVHRCRRRVVAPMPARDRLPRPGLVALVVAGQPASEWQALANRLVRVVALAVEQPVWVVIQGWTEPSLPQLPGVAADVARRERAGMIVAAAGDVARLSAEAVSRSAAAVDEVVSLGEDRGVVQEVCRLAVAPVVFTVAVSCASVASESFRSRVREVIEVALEREFP
jgi:hypothetical protein